jgi:hypothetical protein
MEPRKSIEIVTATNDIEWVEFAGTGSATKICMDGSGGPEAMLNRLKSDREIDPHFHRTAQFQLLINGKMRFPDYQIEGPVNSLHRSLRPLRSLRAAERSGNAGGTRQTRGRGLHER